MEMPEDLWQNTLSQAGDEIVEILTFTRANRAQVKALEEDISLTAARVCVRPCGRVHERTCASRAPCDGQPRLDVASGCLSVCAES